MWTAASTLPEADFSLISRFSTAGAILYPSSGVCRSHLTGLGWLVKNVPSKGGLFFLRLFSLAESNFLERKSYQRRTKNQRSNPSL
jgi:hypothetical protein